MGNLPVTLRVDYFFGFGHYCYRNVVAVVEVAEMVAVLGSAFAVVLVGILVLPGTAFVVVWDGILVLPGTAFVVAMDGVLVLVRLTAFAWS